MNVALAAVLFLSLATVTVFFIGADESAAAPVDATTVANDIMSLPDGGTYTFTDEPDDVIVLNISDGNNRFIDGNGLSLPANGGRLHFSITNTGSGTITFVNMKLTNPGAYGASGGISISGGKYVFENCTFVGLTNAAVYFNGNQNSADFVDCTFKNNTNKSIVLSSGTAAAQAKFDIMRCYFNGNTVTDGWWACRGAAIGINSYSVAYVDIDVHDSAFTGNKVIGTATGSGANNNCDGGAIAVNAENGTSALTVRLNIWDNYFENNFAQDDGGAIFVMGNATVKTITSNIWNCTFTGNTCAGAGYWTSKTTWGITVSAGITNGSGGAISYYGLTDSSVTNCTFYNNGVTNVHVGSWNNYGNVGGGGAIGVDTHDYITDPLLLPPAPVLSNNIFVANYVKNSVYELNTVNVPGLGTIDLGAQYGVVATPYTGNVFVMTGADADRQNPLVIARPITNNGNIGYDNGNNVFDTKGGGSGLMGITRYKDDLGIDVESGLTVENIFINVSGGIPVKEILGSPVGASGEAGQRYYYMPSPRSDELYRDGSGPYYDSALTAVDTLGNPRDIFPSAGAVEIYWTKFNPGAEGDWSVVPAQIGNPADITKPYFVVQSLNFLTNKMYYVVTGVGLPSPEIVAMPRSALTPDNPQYGFAGWRSSQPDMGWWDAAWASANGIAETNVSDFLLVHAVSELPPDAFPLHQPGQLVPSTKQILTAEWNRFVYRVDFSLNYADPPAHPNAADNYWLPSLADITQGGYESAMGIVAPPYTNVPYGDRIYLPKADPVRAGYVLTGWYKEPGLINAWDFASDTIQGDAVLYASWAPACNVVYHDDGADTGSAPADPDSPYPAGSTVTVLGEGTLARTGFAFAGWSASPDSSSPDYKQGGKFVIVRDTDLYPVWIVSGGATEDKVFHIHSSADSGSSIDPSGTVIVTIGGSATFTFSAREGYEIRSVIIDGTAHPELLSAGAYTFSNVTSDHRISVTSTASEERIVDPLDETGGGKWSVLNLILAVIALMAGIIGIAAGRNRVEDNRERRSKTAAILRILGLIIGVVSIIVFILTEDWTLPPTPMDEWSLLMLILFIAAAASVFASFRFDKAEEKDRILK